MQVCSTRARSLQASAERCEASSRSARSARPACTRSVQAYSPLARCFKQRAARARLVSGAREACERALHEHARFKRACRAHASQSARSARPACVALATQTCSARMCAFQTRASSERYRKNETSVPYDFGNVTEKKTKLRRHKNQFRKKKKNETSATYFLDFFKKIKKRNFGVTRFSSVCHRKKKKKRNFGAIRLRAAREKKKSESFFQIFRFFFKKRNFGATPF